MITLKQVRNKAELKEFVKFPFALYKDSPYWVPPIIKDEMDSFDKEKNPVFENAEANFFLAYRGDQVVGRIAAIVNWLEVNDQGIRKMRFGWFDFQDDIDVSKALLDKVAELGKGYGLEFME